MVNQKRRVSLVFLLLSAVVFFVQAGLTFFGGERWAWAINVMYVVLAFLAAFACFVAGRAAVKSDVPQVRTFWLLLGVSFLFFGVGDLYWAYQEVVLENLAPLGTFADASWMAAYGIWIGSLFWFMSHWRRPSYALWAGFLVLILGTPAVLYFSGVLSAITFGGVITALYVALDIALVLLAGYCILRGLDEGRNVAPWLFFGGAIVSRLIFDFLYSGMVSLDVYETGGAIDLLYSMSYVLITSAAHSRVMNPSF